MTTLLLALLAQNVVSGDVVDRTASLVSLGEDKVRELIRTTPGATRTPSAVAAKLAAHVRQFIDGHPWKAFHVTHGISGYEATFDHPDRMFLVLAASHPYLPEQDASRVAAFLRDRLDDATPYSIKGFDKRSGRDRESYSVPEEIRRKGTGRASGALGVYAFWLYIHRTGDRERIEAHWPRILERMNPLLEGEIPFDDLRKRHRNDEAQRLNGNLAGMIGLARLARLRKDGKIEERATRRTGELLDLRIGLDRVNPVILEPTRSTTGQLHVFKLARYCDLVPEVSRALRDHTDGLAAERLRAFRGKRNGWFMAWGDRYTGGENYTSPPHLSHALVAGAAGIEEIEVEAFVDVPWCLGDFYFIEKCALALWVSAGRPWDEIP